MFPIFRATFYLFISLHRIIFFLSYITSVDDSPNQIDGYGDTYLQYFKLKDVLYASDLSNNLLSIYKLTWDNTYAHNIFQLSL